MNKKEIDMFQFSFPQSMIEDYQDPKNNFIVCQVFIDKKGNLKEDEKEGELLVYRSEHYHMEKNPVAQKKRMIKKCMTAINKYIANPISLKKQLNDQKTTNPD